MLEGGCRCHTICQLWLPTFVYGMGECVQVATLHWCTRFPHLLMNTGCPDPDDGSGSGL